MNQQKNRSPLSNMTPASQRTLKLRRIVKATLVVLALASGTASLGIVSMQPALAAATMVKTQPGYYRLMVGSFEVTALSDGTASLPVDQLLIGEKPDQIDRQLAASFLKSPVETSFNAFLINTGSKLILIDAGAGTMFGADSGKLLTSLQAAGYTADQVDEIYLTHLHVDHIGGLLNGSQRAFPNALVRADQKDADFWLSRENAAAAPQDSKPFFEGAVKALQPYIDAGKFRPFSGDGELSPGIRSEASYGHTAGHNSYVIASKGQKLVILGDLIHVAAVQFAHPEVAIGFDSDGHAAAEDRRKVFDGVVKTGDLVAGSHLSFPGLGHVGKEGNGYRWYPLNYGLAR